MSDPRYPVGPFQSLGRPLTGEERAAHIDTIEGHPRRMRAAVEGLDDARLDTPYREGGWTVRQVVHHVVDSHLNSYCRFKLIATEDHPTIRAYEEKEWAELPEAKSAPVGLSLGLLERLHERWVIFLRDMGPDFFARTFHHPESGDMTCDSLLELYAWHCVHHEGHITEVRARGGW